MTATPPAAPRASSTVAAFLFGIPLTLGVLALVEYGPLRGSVWHRYLEHPVEIVELVLFCCALGCLGSKLLSHLGQRAACRRQLLPPWDGQPVPAAEAVRLRATLQNNAGRHHRSWLARRLDAVLDFVGQRGSPDGLDDQLRALADTDALALDNSYALVRFITWAIPILGFLGTVLGITKAIANVTPEVLEHSLSGVTNGLSLAFDTTAVGLALTMATMFLSFVVERLEQSVLERIDQFAEVQLAHRFARAAAAQGGEFTEALRQNTAVLLTATEQLVRQQAGIWAEALAGAQQRFAGALEQALEKTLETHQRRLAALEQQADRHILALEGASREHQEGLARVIDAVAAQTDALARLQDDGKQLLRLQDVLHHDLAALHGAGSFEQAVQMLTAAIRLLTARAAPGATAPATSRLGSRPGTAA